MKCEDELWKISMKRNHTRLSKTILNLIIFLEVR